MKIFCGNLAFNATERDLREMFEAFGTVTDAFLATDRETGRPRGFGFVEMPDAAIAQVAMEQLDGAEIGGRRLVCNEARPPAPGRRDRDRGHRRR